MRSHLEQRPRPVSSEQLVDVIVDFCVTRPTLDVELSCRLLQLAYMLTRNCFQLPSSHAFPRKWQGIHAIVIDRRELNEVSASDP